jgi:hypothetical protein
MCKFKSALVLKNKVFMPYDYDSHEQMIDELKLNDKTNSPEFVRVEIVPIDNNIFNHDLKNWQMKVDQDFRPDWFSEKFAEKEMKEELQKFFAERFVIGRTLAEIKEGKFFVGSGGTIQNVSGGTIQDVRGGTIQNVRGGTIQDVWGGTIQNVRGGTIQDVWGQVVVRLCHTDGKIERLHDNATIKEITRNIPIIYVANKSIKVKVFKNKKVL